MTATELKVTFHDRYHDSLAALEPIEMQRANSALLQFKQDPNHPSLNLHPISGARPGFMSIRAGKELRIVLYVRGNTSVWLFADHHDDAYGRACRLRMAINPNEGIAILGLDGSAYVPLETPAPWTDPDPVVDPSIRRPLDHWTDAELAQVGIVGNDLSMVRALLTAEEAILLLDQPGWDDQRVDTLLEMIERTPDSFFAGTLTGDEDVAAEERLRDAVTRFGVLAGLSPLFDEDELERIASAPIEEWMLFLHPDQRALVDKSFNGPARVRGAAGTGKTVVALHRAAVLAKRYPEPDERILVTTFLKSLTPVLEQLYRRLPSAQHGRVDFLNIDKITYRICAEAGSRPNIDVRAVDSAFASAWKKVVTDDSPIARAGLTREYMRDEINAVINGRGITDLDTYLDVRRTGRKTQFGDALRRQTWELKDHWDAGKAQRGAEDFHDLAIRARDIARARSEPTYRAVIIDEAQDLTLVGLQLLRALVNGQGPDRPDALFISGDGAQRIYPGGFTLRQAGVEVRGRTALLHTNYRNTAEVFTAALKLAGDEAVEDLDEEYRRDEGVAHIGRSGARVELISTTSLDREVEAIIARSDSIIAAGGPVQPGDIGIFCTTNHQAKAVRKALEQQGHAAQDLNAYDGTPSDKIKVGTHHRAKGLEFKVVFLPGLSEDEFPRPRAPGMDEREYADRLALEKSALFVAMTRARDRLILTCTGDPSPVLEPVISDLDCQTY
ncbi:MAG: 3'-5' exonuclease [Microthrixaceae bacterium]